MLTPYRKSASLRTLSSSTFFKFFNSFPDSSKSASRGWKFGELGSRDIMWYKIGLSATICSEGREFLDFLRRRNIVA